MLGVDLRYGWLDRKIKNDAIPMDCVISMSCFGISY